MSWLTASGLRRAITTTAVAAASVGIALAGAAGPAHATPWPCEAEPLAGICPGYVADPTPAGGLSEGQMVPNTDGIPSPPGTPGDL